MKILLVEDDKQTSDYIAKGLREHGHVVDQADNGRDGLYLATGEKYDVMIVDRMLPGMDGLSLVKAARTSSVRTPVLFLTTMGGIDDRVAGFDAGGDDYLVKPFAFAELLARVGALARRPPIVATTVRRPRLLNLAPKPGSLIAKQKPRHCIARWKPATPPRQL